MIALLLLACAAPFEPTPLAPLVPEGFPPLPEDVVQTVEGVELGRVLFHDRRLDGVEDRACGDCHVQSGSFSSDRAVAVLPHVNLGWSEHFLWTGGVDGRLEDAMAFEVEEFFVADLEALAGEDDLAELIEAAFGDPEPSVERLASALAQYERTLVSADSPYDRWLVGADSLSDSALRGMETFFSEAGDCFHCHGGPLFTDNDFHNNGLDAEPDPGRYETTGSDLDLGLFKTPTLRNIALTAPYMHDDRFQSLEEVVDFYSEGLQHSATVDTLMKQVDQGGVHLMQTQKADLVAFLEALTDERFVSDPLLGPP